MEWQGDGGFITRASMCCHSKNFFIATPILSLNMLAQSCSPFFFFSLSLCPVVGARVQEACCYATPSINTQYG